MARLARPRLSRRSVVSPACVVGLLLATLLGCSRPASEEKGPPAGPTRAAERVRLVVFAASSLSDVFNDLEQSFEAANAGVDVALSYGGSQLLKLQIREGAPGDVFASADDAQMAALVSAGLAQPSQTFAHNELVIVVPPDNPAHIGELRDLPHAARLVIGAASVPIGSYTRELFRRAGTLYGASFEEDVMKHVVSEESNVRLVRAKVELGEADAAVIYRTDVDGAAIRGSGAAASTRVKQVALPPELNVRASYPIAVLTNAAQPELARRWVSHVLSPAGTAALEKRGFLVGNFVAANGSGARGVP
jgi:molybdate transport system substrate-binding protein